MNRRDDLPSQWISCLPFVRRDESEECEKKWAEMMVCPSYEGMNRVYASMQERANRLPLVGGDESYNSPKQTYTAKSAPRKRG